MPSPKYPLQPLLEHRERQVEDATAELATKLRARESADVARARAEEERRVAEEHAERVRGEERARLDRGELRAADLARVAEWQVGAEAEIGQLARVAVAAEDAARAAQTAESGARTQLGQKVAERDAVAKDEQRFADRMKKKVLSAEEEAAEEAFRGGRG